MYSGTCKFFRVHVLDNFGIHHRPPRVTVQKVTVRYMQSPRKNSQIIIEYMYTCNLTSSIPHANDPPSHATHFGYYGPRPKNAMRQRYMPKDEFRAYM